MANEEAFAKACDVLLIGTDAIRIRNETIKEDQRLLAEAKARYDDQKDEARSTSDPHVNAAPYRNAEIEAANIHALTRNVDLYQRDLELKVNQFTKFVDKFASVHADRSVYDLLWGGAAPNNAAAANDDDDDDADDTSTAATVDAEVPPPNDN